MNEKEKQFYIDKMKAKALAYAENVSSDVKELMPADDYQETIKDIATAFLNGADAALETIKEIEAQKGNKL